MMAAIAMVVWRKREGISLKCSGPADRVRRIRDFPRIMRCIEITGQAMSTYLELKQQAEKLFAQAEAMREKEIADTIADIKGKIELYGLTAEDLGFARGSASRKKAGPAVPRKASPKGAVKYRGPNGETWSGGRGRKPRWVVDALAAGRNIEEFAV